MRNSDCNSCCRTMRLCALIFLRNFFLLLGCQNHTTVLHIPSSLQNVLEVYTRCMRCSSNMKDSQPVCIDSNVFTKGFLLHPSPVSQGISEYFVKFCFAMFCPMPVSGFVCGSDNADPWCQCTVLWAPAEFSHFAWTPCAVLRAGSLPHLF
jgi:hypothetical protein